jgi:hypothetical protein
MFLNVKFNNERTRTYKILRKKNLPKVGEEFTLRGISDRDWQDDRVECVKIVKARNGFVYHVVEAFGEIDFDF